MQRRSLVGATALLSIASLAPTRLVAAAMNTIDVGPWSFRAPSDWRQVESVNGIPYLESKDGTKGCYIKALTFGRTYGSATDAAAYLQGVHERNFFADPKAKWEVKQRSASTADATATSILDLLDASSNYRVLSVVVAATDAAVQVTLHDYACEDYQASVQAFEPVATSIRGPRGGA
jgi:hypothetical protein